MEFKYLKYFFCALAAFALFRCGNKEVAKSTKDIFQNLQSDTTLKYAKRFSISENENCKIIYLFGSVNIKDTSATFILLKDSSDRIAAKKNAFVLKSPPKKIASLSSVYSNMLVELGEIKNICAVESIDYYNNNDILNKYKSGGIQELSKGPEMDVEKTILLKPDIVFSFGMGYSVSAANEKVMRAGIPVVITVDHLEENPLARAEWVKFFAAFTGKESIADTIFSQVEKNYINLKIIAEQVKTKPKVLTEIKYGEIWYVPGGKSFMSTFIKDAGANYLWSDNGKTGSLNIGFEEVYVKAKDADFWLNLSLVKTKNELLALEKRYGDFKAFKTGNLYNNIKNTNTKGYSDYWETGIMYPDRILSDLIQIFHPELKTQVKNELYYYKKIN